MKNKILTYFYRILGLPFFIITTFIHLNKLWFTYMYNFMKYGGESIIYTHKNMKKTIFDIYNKLENLNRQNNDKI